MYRLSYFQQNDPQVVIDFMRANPFVVLCGADARGNPVATQVPVFIDERDGLIFLSGHIMKNTDHHKAFEENAQSLTIFTGPHAYVSASWYEEKKVASTWNYITVQAKGEIRFTDYQSLIEILKRTTDHFENDPVSPAGFEQLPADYVEKLSHAIVAFEIRVDTLENVFKLSQNRDDTSYKNIVQQLQKGDYNAQQIAAEMAKLR